FGCKEQPLVISEVERLTGGKFGKRIVCFLSAMPYFFCFAARGICHPDGPGSSADRDQRQFLSNTRKPEKGNTATIRRPAWHHVAIGAWRQITNTFAAEIINSNEAVITTIADQGDLASIRRPSWTRVVPAKLSDLMCCRRTRDGSNPQLLSSSPQRELSIWRKFDVFAAFLAAAHLAKHSRSAFIHVTSPNLLLPSRHAARRL